MESSDTGLRSTGYVILGMLALGARTGYDIKAVVDRSTRFFWAASYGQIYPELRRLEEAGLVEGKSSPTGARKRREYQLTAEGRAALVSWLGTPAGMPELRDENLLKLFFADELPVEQALEQLRRRREGHEQFLAILREVDARPGDDPPFVDLVLRYGIAYGEFNVAWCREQEERLRPGSSGGSVSTGPAVAADLRERDLPATGFRSILLRGAPRFAREAFGPVAAFYVGWKLGDLVVGIVLATAVGITLDLYERRRGRAGALALVSMAFVLAQAVVGLIADSAVVYLAQPVLVSAIWGFANIGSAIVGRPLAGVFADAWYPFPPEIRESHTYRRIFGFESIVWGLYLLARSGIRMAVLASGSIGAFAAVQLATGIPFTIALVAWSVWYASRGFERSTEWDDPSSSAGS